MKQVLQNRRGETIVRDVPLPPCGKTDLLVRNVYSAISSGTERTRVQGSSVLDGARRRPELVRQVMSRALHEGVRPTVEAVRRKLAEESAGGYSSAGLVMEVGPGVRGFAVGDQVACAGAGHANHAEIVSVPVNLCARVPQQVELRTASLTTIAAIALHSLRLSGVRLGERVAIVGCGLVGQIACRLARAAGAEVFALDIDRSRVERALAGGADHGMAADVQSADELVAQTSGTGLDHVIVTAAANSAAPLLLAVEAARDRGSVTLVGDVPIQLPREPLYRKELRFRVSRSYGPGRYDAEYERHGLDYPIGYVRWTERRNMEAVLQLQALGRLSLEDLIEVVIPVAQAGSAFGRLAAPPGDRPVGAIVLEYAAATAARERQSPAAPKLPAKTARVPALGLIGPGGFAQQVLVPAFTSAGAELELVAGGGGLSAELAVRELGFRRYAHTPEELIVDPKIDIVAIASRHADHAELARAALLAGKHVFCEKPLALGHDELDSVLEVAHTAGRVLAVGFNRRFSPWIARLADFARTSSGPLSIVYRVSAGSLEPGDWRNDLSEGGGRLVGEVCHFIDTIRFLTGQEITAVQCTGRGDSRLPLAALDNLFVSLECADGSIGGIAYVPRGEAGLGKERVELFGAAGAGVIDDYRSIALYRDGSVTRSRERSQDKGHWSEIRAFIEAVRRGDQPVSLDEVENSSRATLEAVRSLATGRRIPVGRSRRPGTPDSGITVRGSNIRAT